jgi:hypothetical protein
MAIVLSVVLGVFATPATLGQAAGSICNSAPLAFHQADFVDAKGNPIAGTNPYFPLTPGTVYTYEGNGQRETVTVTKQRTTIDGVSTQVVNDIVDDAVTNARIETTTDYFAQDRTANVWYFAEDTLENQTGSRAGSWRSGLNGSSAGIVMEANPRRGDSYRQEFAPNATDSPALDFASVVSTSATVSVPAGTFTNGLQTRDGSCSEGGFENKYYARGVGLVLTTKGNTRLELVGKR